MERNMIVRIIIGLLVLVTLLVFLLPDIILASIFHGVSAIFGGRP